MRAAAESACCALEISPSRSYTRPAATSTVALPESCASAFSANSRAVASLSSFMYSSAICAFVTAAASGVCVFGRGLAAQAARANAKSKRER